MDSVVYPIQIGTMVLAQVGILALCLRFDLSTRLTLIPFASFAALDYLFFMGLFPFVAHYRPLKQFQSSSMSVDTMVFIVMAQGLFFAGYFIALTWRNRHRPQHRDFTVGLPERLVGWAGLMAAFLFHFFPLLSSIPSLPQVNRPLWLMGIAILTFALVNRQMGRWERVLFLLLLPLKLFMELMSGYSSLFILGCFTIIFVLFVKRSWYWLAGGGMVVFLTLASYIPVKKAYNWSMGYEVFSAGGVSNELSSVFDPIKNLDHVARRSTQGLLLQHVIAMTPSQVPYWQGSTLLGVVTNSIPRAVWKEKPEERLGNSFGQAYKILTPYDNVTSWNVPWLVEFYMNFGKIGALGCMIVVGTVIGLLVRWIGRRPPAQQMGLAAAAIIPLFHPESNVSLMLGNHLWIILVIVSAFWLSHRLVAVARARISP
jgi:hypothetical protein